MLICRVRNVFLLLYREAAISLVRLSAVVVRAVRLVVRADMGSVRLVVRADMGSVRLVVRTDMGSVRLVVRADMRGVRLVLRADMLAMVMSSMGSTMMGNGMLMMARTLGHGDRGRGNNSNECKYLVHVCYRLIVFFELPHLPGLTHRKRVMRRILCKKMVKNHFFLNSKRGVLFLVCCCTMVCGKNVFCVLLLFRVLYEKNLNRAPEEARIRPCRYRQKNCRSCMK